MENQFENCIQNKQIKFTGKIKSPKPEIRTAEHFLEEAYELIELGKNEFAIIALYNSIFHAGRAILFHKG